MCRLHLIPYMYALATEAYSTTIIINSITAGL